MTHVPALTLNDGTRIPQLGFGTMDIAPERDDLPASHEITAATVLEAARAGYRHFDTAQMYVNERGVGLGLERSGVPRDELFLTSKLSNANHRPDDVRRSFERTLSALGTDYLDLFLIHWPTPTLYDGDYVSTWRAVVELLEDGRLRSAGVSNFEPEHLERIIGETGHVPSADQIGVYPYFANRGNVEACAAHGIAVEAWSPLGQGSVLNDPVITAIAAAHERSAADVVLRWHTQSGRIAIPKTTKPERMAQHLATFDFDLTAEELAAISGLDRGEAGRRGGHPNTFDFVPTPDHPKP